MEKSKQPIAKASSSPKLGFSVEHIKIKRHQFKKVNFEIPTWCIFANKFIWGLDKTGYECKDCGMICSRQHITLAKKTVCSTAYKNETLVSAVTTEKGANSNIFTIHMPMGAKKSFVMNPSDQLKEVLVKICTARGITLDEYYPQDKNGKVVALSKKLGEIDGCEITFTKKDASQRDASLIPPLIEDLEREESLRNQQLKSARTDSGKKDKHKKGSSSGKDKTKNTPRSKKDQSDVASESNGPNSARANLTASSNKVLVEKSIVSVERVPDAYTLEIELGNGAFSVVYSGKHKKTGNIVAIKVLEKYKDEDTQQKKLRREIAIHSFLAHENIIKFIQLDEDEDHFYVVMELVTGGELFEQVCTQRYYYEKDAAPLLCQVAQGLIYLHDRGIAHRDIKPENLLFKDGDMKCLKIADFGESKTFIDNQLNTYCGTSDYMAPEIIKALPYSKEVDIWALGVTAFVLMGGYAPFEGDNDTEVFAAILTLDYKYISPEWDHVGNLGKEFVDSLLKLEPSQRLTARQIMSHPFIEAYCTPEMRKVPEISLNQSEFDNNPRQACLKIFDQYQGILKNRMSTAVKPEILKEDKLLYGELESLLQIIQGSGTGTITEFEKKIFGIVWARLLEIRPFIYT